MVNHIWNVIVLLAVGVPPVTNHFVGFDIAVIISLSLLIYIGMGVLEGVARTDYHKST